MLVEKCLVSLVLASLLPPEAADFLSAHSQQSISKSSLHNNTVLLRLKKVRTFRLNAEIQRTLKRYWENVPGAIARLFFWRFARIPKFLPKSVNW
jgi:hypothetical protein